jgi:hypothetical protein
LVKNERKGYWIPYEIEPVALEKCGELLSTLCTCGCKGTGQFREAELNAAEDKVAVLRKYEQELLEEIKTVQTQIEELAKEV